MPADSPTDLEFSTSSALTPDFEFSTDPTRLDRERVHRWLAEESYWAIGRSRAANDAAIAASRNYGIFDRATGEQLAYARVITDGVTFAWLCDVFVAVEARGRGFGVALIDGVIASLSPLGLRRIALATGDAHGLYEKFGFRALDQPEQWMSRGGAVQPE
jgi:GNAT superfamily N-acetyltransferase